MRSMLLRMTCLVCGLRVSVALLGGGLLAAGGASLHAQESSARKPPSDVVHRLERDGLSLEMAPLSFEQVTGFFVGRGLSKEDAELAARRGCFFRLAIGNTFTAPADPSVRIALGAWRVVGIDTATGKLGLREDWDRFWRGRGLAEVPSVAFHWALFPSEQVFAPTDHNWGFLSFMLAPGTAFALDIAWQTGNQPHRARVNNMGCAP